MHLTLAPAFNNRLAVLDSSLHTCIISIIYHDYRLGEAHDKPYLVVCKCGSGAADDILYPIFMEGNNIKLPLDKISKSFFGDCSLAW